MNDAKLEFLRFYNEEKEFLDRLIKNCTAKHLRSMALYIKKRAMEEEKLLGETMEREAIRKEILRELKRE